MIKLKKDQKAIIVVGVIAIAVLFYFQAFPLGIHTSYWNLSVTIEPPQVATIRASPSGIAIEDFSSYYEEDQSNCISVNTEHPEHLDFTSDGGLEAYMCKILEEGDIEIPFTHEIDTRVTGQSGNGDGMFWLVSNNLGNWQTLKNSANAVAVGWIYLSDGYHIYLEDTSENPQDSIVLSENTDYYLTIKFTAISRVEVSIYSDPQRTNQVGNDLVLNTLSFPVNYLYVAMNPFTSLGSINIECENLNLGGVLGTDTLYLDGTGVRLTPTIAQDYDLDYWDVNGEIFEGGDVNPTLTVTMTEDTDVTAYFTGGGETRYILTTSVDPDNGDITLNPEQPAEGYLVDTPVELTLTTDDGWQLDYWSGGGTSGNENPTTVIMDSHKTVVANLKDTLPDVYTLDISVIGSGSVSKNPDESSYMSGSTVEITAIPDSGWIFDHWSDDLSGKENPTDVYMDGHKDINAHFIEEPPESPGFEIATLLVSICIAFLLLRRKRKE